MFEAAAKDLRRLRSILKVVSKYGYGELVKKSPLAEELANAELSDSGQGVSSGAAPASLPPAERGRSIPPSSGPRRFRLMLEELGPTFIKFGQVLSSRPDLISAPYIEELKQLQYQCAPLSYPEIAQALKEGLRGDPAELFSRIDPEAIATASVAQVHRATTREGIEVVVKVQRPGIGSEIRSDIVILYRIARLLDAVIEESAIAEPVGVVREFELAINAELNFELEAANIREFTSLHAGREDIVIPSVYPELSSQTVLTLGFLDGTPFTHLPRDADHKKIGLRMVQEAFDEVFLDGFFHADPHPGNLLLLKDGRYGILDFGLCGRLTPQMRETLVVLALAIALRDADTASRTLYRAGQVDARVDIAALRDDINGLFQRYLGRRLEEVDSTLLLQELLMLALKHKIRVPAEYTMLGRAGATIEGIVRQLDPDLDIAKVAAPYAERLLLERVGPDNLQGGIYKALLQFQGLSQDVPLQLVQILNDLAAGNFNVNVRGPGVERLTATLLMATAAISASILGGAFIVGAFIALSRVDWAVFGVPIVALGAGLFGLTVFFWVAAYVVFRPRLRKIRISRLLRKGKP